MSGASTWTSAEDEILRRYWGEQTLKSIGRLVDKSADAVWQKGRRLGLPPYRPKGGEEYVKTTTCLPETLLRSFQRQCARSGRTVSMRLRQLAEQDVANGGDS